MKLNLPIPPSANRIWRRVGNRTLLSREGRQYRKRVCDILQILGVQPMTGPLDVRIDFFPPDRRRRDLDNLNKALLDALAFGGAYHDDSQIFRLMLERREVMPGGGVRVQIEKYVQNH
ncbi:MAG: RusA family crossover junction endodeoxyribonuclease [Planctomycetaceae bacterium]|nr:RusA family crossover junction endodeoxyribonuclease [Planctomycetaceae bacterium]